MVNSAEGKQEFIFTLNNREKEELQLLINKMTTTKYAIF